MEGVARDRDASRPLVPGARRSARAPWSRADRL